MERLRVKYFLGLFLFCTTISSASTLVKIPGGRYEAFWIQPKDQGKKAPEIEVAPFQVMPYAVTNKEFQIFLKKNPSWNKENISPLYSESSYVQSFNTKNKMKKGISAKSPVTYVSWFAARAYCDSLGMRLPTMEEWEYIGQADESHPNASKDPGYLARILDWYGKPRMGQIPKVGSTFKNFYGVYDLHGLIWEWVEDFNSILVTGESREDSSFNKDLFCGSGSLSGGNKENYAAFMRFGFRSSLKGSNTIWNLGFRCVL